VQELAVKALDNVETVNAMIKELVAQREWLENELLNVSAVIHVYPSDANFLLVKVTDATSMYQHLIHNKIVVRDRSKVVLCENAMRITVGTEKENKILIQAMNAWQG
jgi:histidinol-phosphate aminotransferase